LALGVRLFNLGIAPLSEFEAEWGMQAFEAAKGAAVQVGSQPLYVLLTSLLFEAFGSAEFLARLLPAVVGSLVIWLVYEFRQEVGRTAALILAVALALDAGLVAVSRYAGGPVLAVVFGLGAIAFWKRGRFAWAGIMGGLALLSGPQFFTGAAALALAWTLYQFVREGRQSGANFEIRLAPAALRSAALSALAAVLIAGTLFLQQPQGLAGMVASASAYFSGWRVSSGVAPLQVGAALIVYHPVALLFGGLGIVSAISSQSNLKRWLSVWFIAGLGLALIYPARQVGDLVWALIPLWTLAAIQLASLLAQVRYESIATWGQAGLTTLLAVFLWLNIAIFSRLDPLVFQEQYLQSIYMILGIAAFGIFATFLIAYGWSVVAARGGLVLASLAVLGVYSLAAMWGAAHRPERLGVELWTPQPSSGQDALFGETLASISEWRVGNRFDIDIVSQVDNDSMRWALRLFPEARFDPRLELGEVPSIIITDGDGSEPQLASGYRGQSFAWQVSQDWSAQRQTTDWLRWLFYREGPSNTAHVILWARADLFPDGEDALSDFPISEQ
jgi:hypothetical protein